MQTWLIKSEPDVYGWAQFVKDGRTAWTGVRSAEARNNLRAMKLGDRALFYHSNLGKECVGIAEVIQEHYPDPTAEGDPRWLCVDFRPVEALEKPVTLATFKADAILAESKLVKQGRVSVVPLTAEQFAHVLALAGR